MSSCKTYSKKPKVKHATRLEAEGHLVKQEKSSAHVHKMQVYRCHVCSFWHIGRIPRPRKMKNPNYDEILVGKLIGILRGTYNNGDQV